MQLFDGSVDARGEAKVVGVEDEAWRHWDRLIVEGCDGLLESMLAGQEIRGGLSSHLTTVDRVTSNSLRFLAIVKDKRLSPLEQAAWNKKVQLGRQDANESV